MAIRNDYSAFEDFGGLDYFTPEDSYQPEGSYYTYGAIPSAVPEEEPVYVPRQEPVAISPSPAPIAPLSDERVFVPRGETVDLTPPPAAEPGPVQEFVGTPYMPQFDVTPVAPPLSQVEERTYVPREETVPVSPPPTAYEAPVYVPRETSEVVAPVAPIAAPLSTPAPAPASTTTEPPKTDIFAAMKAFGAAPSLLPPLAQAGTGGKDLTAGDLYKSERERLVSDYDKQVAVLKAAGNFTPQNDEALKATLNYQLDKLVKDETNYLNTLPQRQALSELLKANKFSEAYQYAKDNGLQLLLTQPTELKNLRDPFTKEEARQFIRAMPQEFIKSAYGDQYKFDDAWTFDPEGAESRGALTWVAGMGPEGPIMSETGYPQLDRILQAKEVRNEPGVFQDIFKAAALAAAVFGGAQALGALGGGAGAGAAGTAGAGAGAAGAGVGGLSSVGTTLSTAAKSVLGIPEWLGSKIAEGFGYGSIGSTGAKVIGNAVISGGLTGAKGGNLEDILKSAALAAGLTYVTDSAIKTVAKNLQGSGVLNAAKNIPGGDVTAASTSTVNNLLGGIEQFDIFTKGASLAQTAATTAAPLLGVQEFVKPEVTVTGTKVPDFGAGLETGLYTGTRGASFAGAEQPFIPAETIADQQQVTVPGETEAVDVTSPIVQEFLKNYVPDTEFKPAETVGGLQQITSTADLSKLDLTDPLIQTLVNRYVDVKPPAPVTDNLEEFTVETYKEPNVGVFEYSPPIFTPINPADILKDYQPTQVKESGLDQLKSAISKYQDLQKLLKLIGALGAGASGGKTVTPTTGGAPSAFGGALPKYELKRTQYTPAIDYYNYGLGPEAKFFDYEMKPVDEQAPEYYAPNVSIVPPKDRPPVFQSGGLTGYAQGGDSSPQYVDGPGSGRDDKIPALLSDGEYVIDAETLALLGDGSTKEGARRMDEFRAKIRKHKGRALSRGRISPDAKSPDKYMGGGLT